MKKRLILASASPRRSELLRLAGYDFEIITSSVDEVSGGMSARELVGLNALAKARDVFDRCGGDCVVIGADTVVSLGGKVLGKPKDKSDAKAMLKELSGSKHSVLSGFAVISGEREESGVCETFVKFRELSDIEIESYVATGEPLDKAGAYGIQEKGSLLAESVEGDFFNVIGLPVAKLYCVLKNFAIYPEW